MRKVIVVLFALIAVLGLSQTAAATAKATVTWNNCANEEGYKILLSTAGGAFVQVGAVSVDVLSFVQTGLAEGQSYSYKVNCFSAFDPTGITTPASTPYTPQAVGPPGSLSIGVIFEKE